ncbi:Sialin [Chionoecetes opilio]|uniref:Sialin n=1 Tax=Chionoecetes opilio TaxID=41210 RepID=A0A8J5D0C0_CHIOP|nr:Sialin [Chionoecetes opilio]
MCRGSRNQVEDGGDPLVEVIHPRTRSGCVCAVGIRHVVVGLGLLGCLLDYLMRFGLSMAIIAMVNTTHTTNHTVDNACPAALNGSHDTPMEGEGEFSWTVQEQGIILGTFFWGYFFTKTIGGRIGEVMGSRETMAVSLGVSSVLTMLTPTMAALHPMALAALRFIMGVFQGPAFPSLYAVLVRWAPQDKVATMTTIAFSGRCWTGVCDRGGVMHGGGNQWRHGLSASPGMALGSVVAMGSSQWVVDHMGWRWVFWGAGILGLVWTPFWVYFVRNVPCHPLMSRQEKELLAPNLAIKPKRRVPWGRLLRCWRFYPTILMEFANSWLGNFTTTQGPTFLNTQVGLSMQEVGFVLTVGQSSAWLGAFTFGGLSDWLLQSVRLKKVNTRRLSHSIGMLMVVAGLVSVVLAGCHKWMVSAMMMVIMIGGSATLSSFTLTPMDIAPNYAGTLSGLVGIGNIGGFLAPVITAELVTQSGGWHASMLVCGATYTLAGLLYLATTTAEVQDWNDYEELPSSEDAE